MVQFAQRRDQFPQQRQNEILSALSPHLGIQLEASQLGLTTTANSVLENVHSAFVYMGTGDTIQRDRYANDAERALARAASATVKILRPLNYAVECMKGAICLSKACAVTPHGTGKEAEVDSALKHFGAAKESLSLNGFTGLMAVRNLYATALKALSDTSQPEAVRKVLTQFEIMESHASTQASKKLQESLLSALHSSIIARLDPSHSNESRRIQALNALLGQLGGYPLVHEFGLSPKTGRKA